MKTEEYKLYPRVFWIFPPNIIKIDFFSGKQKYQEPGVEAELNCEFFESYYYIF